MIIYILPLCVTVITLQPDVWGGSILLIKKEEEARVWECVLLLCPLDTSIWITSGRIRPSWSSHLDLEHTHTLVHNYTLMWACADALWCVLWCFLHTKTSQRKSGWLQRESSCLCSLLSSFFLWLQLVCGLWQILQPRCVPICSTHRIVRARLCVYVLLPAPLSCPTSAQIRVFVSWGRQKYKNKAFYQNTDLNTYVYIHILCAQTHTHTPGVHYESLQREGQRALLQQNPKSPFLWVVSKLQRWKEIHTEADREAQSDGAYELY